MERRSFLKRAGLAIAGIPLVGGFVVAKGGVKVSEAVELMEPDKYYIRITDAGGRYIYGTVHPKLYTHIQMYDHNQGWITYTLIEPGQNMNFDHSIPISVRFLRVIYSEMRTLDNFHGPLEVCGKNPGYFRTIS